MKKLFFIIGLFFSLSAAAQPTNYTKINMRYRWLSGMFDSALYVPRYNGTPSGVRVNETSVFDGMVAMDTTNNRLYIYSGGSWVRLANYSEIPAVTNIYNSDGTIPGQRVVTIPDGSELQFFLDVTGKFNVTNDAGDTIIYALGNSGLFLPSVPTVSSTTGRKVALIDTATGKVERIDPATLVTTPTLQQVLTAGSTLTTNHTIDGDNNDLLFSDFSNLDIQGNSINVTSNSADINLTSSQDIAISGTQEVRLSSSTSGLKISLTDSIKLTPFQGVLNIDSIRTWSGVSDTTHKKPMTWDTRNGRWEYAANWPQQKINLVFGAGSGADADTTAFTTSAIYGSFYNDADTIVVTSMRSVLQGTSPDVTYKVWYNDSLNVEAGATALVTAGSQVTNTTTGTNVTSFDVTKIPPGVWVWVKTSTVATKPKYFSLTLNGYRK